MTWICATVPSLWNTGDQIQGFHHVGKAFYLLGYASEICKYGVKTYSKRNLTSALHLCPEVIPLGVLGWGWVLASRTNQWGCELWVMKELVRTGDWGQDVMNLSSPCNRAPIKTLDTKTSHMTSWFSRVRAGWAIHSDTIGEFCIWFLPGVSPCVMLIGQNFDWT